MSELLAEAIVVIYVPKVDIVPNFTIIPRASSFTEHLSVGFLLQTTIGLGRRPCCSVSLLSVTVPMTCNDSNNYYAC